MSKHEKKTLPDFLFMFFDFNESNKWFVDLVW